MAKLRKMLGRADAPETQALMRLIETQSRITLAKWASDFARERYLPILQAALPEEARPAKALEACARVISGECKFSAIKPVLRDAQAAARECTDPLAQAAARAISTACGVYGTPTNALGFMFYGAAAAAYAELGLEARAGEYDAFAASEFERALASLHSAAIENEPEPVKIDWNC